MFSHDPADLDEGVYPAPSHRRTTFLALPGAWIARALVGGLGAAAYVFLAAWFVLVLLLFLRRGWLTWGLRLVGWLLLTPCAARVLADRFGGDWPGGPPGRAGRSARRLVVALAGGASSILVCSSPCWGSACGSAWR